jgi:hypothetical protein
MMVPTIVTRAAKHGPISPNVAVLGYVSMLTALSSAMIYRLLPVFPVRPLGLSTVSVGLIEGMAEAANFAACVHDGHHHTCQCFAEQDRGGHRDEGDRIDANPASQHIADHGQQ